MPKHPWLNTEYEALNWSVPPTLLASYAPSSRPRRWQPQLALLRVAKTCEAHDALRQPQGPDRAFNCVHLWFDPRRGDAALPR